VAHGRWRDGQISSSTSVHDVRGGSLVRNAVLTHTNPITCRSGGGQIMARQRLVRRPLPEDVERRASRRTVLRQGGRGSQGD
jgi:hypothetical protein